MTCIRSMNRVMSPLAGLNVFHKAPLLSQYNLKDPAKDPAVTL